MLRLVFDSKRQMSFVVAIFIIFCTVSAMYADSIGGPGGTWPKSWPKELESLRKQASTWVGGEVLYTAHEIPFVDREKFEAAWTHILRVKSKGASITLMNGPGYYGRSSITAGVMILPPLDNVTAGELATTRIVLLVDGKILDLNRIRIPADTPIVDQRFKK